jgi:subtilase family serine protease
MASQGQSFFQAAGDSGAYHGTSAWPSNSQYFISVGGTDLETQSAGGPWKSETVWVDGGGGYGTNVDIPSWQQLPGVITSKNEGSTTYRNIPDVSANSNFTFYVCADQDGCTANEYGGTSFAAPMWAGYLALANQQAAANGNAAPGFIDPAIYPLGLGAGYDTDFHDITVGNEGFPAETGYDLATGWGSPNTNGLINALLGSGSGGAGISFAPASLSWGKKVVGSTTSAKKVVVTNSGTATLNITSIAISGDFALATVKATKKVTPCANGSTVAPGATCEIAVTFSPLTEGALTGAVTFTDNAAGSPQQVTLSGTGKD